MFIDADTHVDECEATWQYMPKSAAYLAPRNIEFEKDQIPSWYPEGWHRMWFIDGQLYPRRYRSEELTGTTPEKRELADIPGRLQDMDKSEISVQIMYPTLFLEELTLKPEVDVALCAAYNRWLAERCANSAGRFRWVAMIPYTSMADALSEMRWAKDAGACGIFKRGIEAGGRAVSDPYFFDVYSCAVDLNLPVCLHASTAWNPVSRNTASVRVGLLGAIANIGAFHTFISARIPQQFPGLRIGFIESGSAWLTFILSALPAFGEMGGQYATSEVMESTRWSRAMTESRLFITSEVREDLPYLISKIGDDSLMIGSDYSHDDRSSVKDVFKRITTRSDISVPNAAKLTSGNAGIFYGIDSIDA